MKALLKFNLDNPDDRDAYERCNKANAMTSVLWDFLFNTRKGIEFTVEEKDLDRLEAVGMVYDRLWEMIKDESIDLERLWK